MRLTSRLLIFTVMLALSACKSSSSDFEPGQTTLQEILNRMGQPSMAWTEPDGSLQIEFSHLANKQGNFMAWMRPDGRLLRFEQVLTEARVADLKPGLNRDQVRRQLGRPSVMEHLPQSDIWHWALPEQKTEAAQVDIYFNEQGLLEKIAHSPLSSVARQR